MQEPSLFDDEIRTKVQFTAEMEISAEELEVFDGDLEGVISNALSGIDATLLNWEEI